MLQELQVFHTGGYSRGNYNFIISGLPERKDLSPTEATLFNILFRGSPTKPSIFLQNKLNELGIKYQEALAIIPLDGKYIPFWETTILGQDAFRNPALEFFRDSLPQALGEYRILLSLIRPECPIEQIIDSDDTKAFFGERVDFFLPCANVVIEIDGGQHDERVHSQKDAARDKLFYKNDICVLRIKTRDLKNTEKIESFSTALRKRLKESMLVEVYMKHSTGQLKETDLALTHAFRLQVIMVEAMSRGLLSLDDSNWNLEILGDVGDEISLAAIEDLFNWIQLLSGRTGFPSISFDSNSSKLTIEISIYRRWDEQSLKAEYIYSATDHFDYFPEVSPKNATGSDYYRSIYSKTEEPFDTARLNLTSLLEEVFGYDEFNPGQIEVIENVLVREDTIGILPTGGGKSLCYQLPGILSGGLTLVVCPIKSLMRDQVQELQQIGFHRAACVVGIRTHRIPSSGERVEPAQRQRSYTKCQ